MSSANKRKSMGSGAGVNPFLTTANRASTAVTNFLSEHPANPNGNDSMLVGGLDLSYNERRYQSRLAKKVQTL